MWKKMRSDNTLWVLAIYVLVRGNHEWQIIADVLAGAVAIMAANRIYHQSKTVTH